mgnify:CR=1 FL=1
MDDVAVSVDENELGDLSGRAEASSEAAIKYAVCPQYVEGDAGYIGECFSKYPRLMI